MRNVIEMYNIVFVVWASKQLGQWFPTGVPFTVPRGAAGKHVFYHIIKNTFSSCYQTSKQIAMGAVNYYSFL